LVALENFGVREPLHIIRAAAWTQHLAIWPAQLHHETMAIFVIREVDYRLLKCCWLFRFHASNVAEIHLSVKYIIARTRANVNATQRVPKVFMVPRH
jgi:hypothetical protein